jgi:hypothetical protein
MKHFPILIGLLCTLCAGCASMHRFSADLVDKSKPLRPYWATSFDVALVVSAPFAAVKGNDMIFGSSGNSV